MSRVLNANEFLLQWRKIRQSYSEFFESRIAELRRAYTGTPQQGQLDASLEIHSREYVVNAMLAALNWRLDKNPEDGLPNLFPEVPVRSLQNKNVRFLDYLGLEKETKIPLLIVETKRPSSELPLALEKDNDYSPSEVVCRGLAGKPLSGEWNEWIDDLRDYFRSTFVGAQKSPKRMVITNGDWLIVFLDPWGAFGEGGECRSDKILVFSKQDDLIVPRMDVETRYAELFLCLEYWRVSGKLPPLTIGELPFNVEGGMIDRAMHGLRLHYGEQGIYKLSPVILVAPVIFLRSRFGAWIRIEDPTKEYELYHDKDRLSEHLHEVEVGANNLLIEVNRCLGISLRPVQLSQHYDDEEAFSAIRGVEEQTPNEYIVATGINTHYLLGAPTVPNCPFHDWSAANNSGVAAVSGPNYSRSISPRSFFFSPELHYCAHGSVDVAKASQITDANRLRCGSRSGQDGEAFCEIWRFEVHLCCRTCAFQEVCTKATVLVCRANPRQHIQGLLSGTSQAIHLSLGKEGNGSPSRTI